MRELTYGAQVTAVVATRHLDLVKSLGADRAIDPTAQDFTQIGETFDLVFGAVGKASFYRCPGTAGAARVTGL